MSKILLVAVDLDGTLINTKDALEQAFKLALKDLGVITNNLDYLKCGYSFSQICSKFGLMHEDIEKLRLLKDTYYSSNLKLTSINMPVLKLINSLDKNTKVGIVTNSRRYSAELVLKHHNLSRKIDHLITSDDIINPKPHPEPYLKMLEISGIDASNCIAIEDSEIGRQSSIAANITTFSINLINSSA